MKSEKVIDIILSCGFCGYRITETEKTLLSAGDVLCPRCSKMKLSNFNIKQIIKDKTERNFTIINGDKS